MAQLSVKIMRLTGSVLGENQHRMAAELEALKSEATLIIITHNPGVFSGADQVVDFEAMK
jgi:subfamily B ATP-binding cassette protein HlyB/CyaB